MLLLIDTLLGQGKLREKKRQSLLIQNQKQCELKLESVCLLGLCNSYNFSSLLSLFPTSDLSLHLSHLHIFSAPTVGRYKYQNNAEEPGDAAGKLCLKS